MIEALLRAGFLFDIEILESLLPALRRLAGGHPRFATARNLDSAALAPDCARRIFELAESSGATRERRLAHYPSDVTSGRTGSGLDSDLGRRIAGDARTAYAALDRAWRVLADFSPTADRTLAASDVATAAEAVKRLRALVAEG